MRKSLPFILLALALGVVLPTMAQPNFSGTWKLDKSKSTSGHFPAHPSMIWEISHEGSQFKIHFKISRDQGEVEHDAVFTTDGKDCSNDMAGADRLLSSRRTGRRCSSTPIHASRSCPRRVESPGYSAFHDIAFDFGRQGPFEVSNVAGRDKMTAP